MGRKKKKQASTATNSGPSGNEPKQDSASDWELAKTRGNLLYSQNQYEEAIEQYCLAISLLELDTAEDNSAEMAKLYGNKSAACYQLAVSAENGEASSDIAEILQKALNDGMKSVKLDASYEKGHFRCALVLLKLGRTQEAVPHLTHVLDSYRWRGADYRNDKLIVRTMAECHYLSAAKHRSVNWPSIQFKDNCFVVDPLGAGDYMSLSVCLSSIQRPASVLLRPGKYTMTESVKLSLEELDIIGDIDDSEDEEPSDVTIHCKGLYWGAACGWGQQYYYGDDRHSSNGRDGDNIHSSTTGAVTELYESTAVLTNCHGYSRRSGFIAVDRCATLTMKDCTIQEASGGVIVTNKSYATIDKCVIKNSYMIGVEVRANGFVVIQDSVVTNSGSQGLVAHAGALGYIARRCIFSGNSFRLPQQCSVFIAAGVCRIEDCQITSQSGGGGGVMVQDGGCGHVVNTRISGGRIGFGFTTLGSARLTNCTVAGVHFGVSIVVNKPAEVVMEDNKITAKLAEVMISGDDDPPKMIGATRHNVMTQSMDLSSARLKKELLRQVKLSSSDSYIDEAKWGDVRNTVSGVGRRCVPCGLAQRPGAKRYLRCSACKLSWYCSKECQQMDWPTHKNMCMKIQEVWKKQDAEEAATAES